MDTQCTDWSCSCTCGDDDTAEKWRVAQSIESAGQVQF